MPLNEVHRVLSDAALSLSALDFLNFNIFLKSVHYIMNKLPIFVVRRFLLQEVLRLYLKQNGRSW